MSNPSTSYGLAPAAALGEAAAQIIRDPNEPEPELVVIADEHLSEEVYLAARLMLRTDKRDAPLVDGRRVITIMLDGLIRLDANGQTKWRRPS